jgi:hypothetical protein
MPTYLLFICQTLMGFRFNLKALGMITASYQDNQIGALYVLMLNFWQLSLFQITFGTMVLICRILAGLLV